jgi:hypothetical protein
MAKLTKESLKKKIDALKVGERVRLLNLDEDIYHAAEGVGSSLLKQAAQSLAHYKAAFDHIQEDERTQAQKDRLNEGSATHCAVLQPELFDEEYIVIPDTIKKRAGKEWAAFKEANADKTILPSKSLKVSIEMADAVLDSVGHYFTDGEAEVSYFYRHETGMILKGRIDYERGDALIDLKTSKDTTPEKFSRSVKYDYDWQDALYRFVTGKKEMLFIGVEYKSPHSVFFAKQGSDVRIRAERRLKAVLDQLAFAIEFQEFPPYPVDLIETTLTAYEKGESL